MYIAWYYHDFSSGYYYYTESYTMSVTEFAEKVSKILGRTITAADTSAASRKDDLKKPNLIHI
ncbi:MAG: hypothetical protein IKT38_01755 [Clostridia bacterium]|nr:hypothetical protein [Clostridia bacterium]